MRGLGPTVLMYHDVVDRAAPDTSGFPGAAAASFKIDFRRFGEHLAAIAVQNRSVSAHELVPLDEQWRLTFDDGGVSSVTRTAHALEAVNLRGLFFVATDFIGRPGFMDEGQIRELRRRGHAIGSHSRTHPKRLSALSRSVISAEWRDSVQVLSELLGEQVDVASVPNGYYSQSVGEQAEAHGIRVLYTSEPTRRRRRIGSCTVVGRFAVRATSSAVWAASIWAGDPFSVGVQAMEWRLKNVVRRVTGERYFDLRKSIRLPQDQG